MPRPTKLTPELSAGIVGLVEHAVHPVVAAASFGVARSTLYEWLERGTAIDPRRPMEPIYAEFADSMDAAEAKAESALVALALAKARTSADALGILERRYGERWRQQRLLRARGEDSAVMGVPTIIDAEIIGIGDPDIAMPPGTR